MFWCFYSHSYAKSLKCQLVQQESQYFYHNAILLQFNTNGTGQISCNEVISSGWILDWNGPLLTPPVDEATVAF